MLAFEPKKIKLNFPILKDKDDKIKFVYLDNGATTQKPKEVIDAIIKFYEYYNSNVHRCVHDLGEGATTFYEQARFKVAKFINASPSEIIFTKGTTEGINFIAEGWGRKNVSAKDRIVVTQVEHHANFLPWKRLADEKGAEFKLIKLDPKTFTLKFDLHGEDKDLINSKTKIVALTHTSNVLGDVWENDEQLENVIKHAHKVGARVLMDAAQSSPRRKIDVKKLNVDFLAFSGHKMLGPTGVGVLYIKKEVQDEVEPYQLGGAMVAYASEDKVIWKEAPHKFEAGTPPIAQVIGLGRTIDYLNDNVNFDDLQKHEANLCKALIEELEKMDGIKIWGNVARMKKSGHLVSFSVNGVHAHDLSAYLGKRGIAVRSGQHCAQPVADFLGIDASLRVSFYLYNTMEDVQIFVKELKEAIKFFKK